MLTKILLTMLTIAVLAAVPAHAERKKAPAPSTPAPAPSRCPEYADFAARATETKNAGTTLPVLKEARLPAIATASTPNAAAVMTERFLLSMILENIYEADPSAPEAIRQRAIKACTGSPRWHGSLALPRTTPMQPAVAGLKPGDCVTYQDGTK